MNQSTWITIAGITGCLAVILGAFGAHGLESALSAERLDTYHVGVRYHFYHALALLTVVLMADHNLWNPWGKTACLCWLFGIIIFSGTLYILAVTGYTWLGMITPIGGVLFIIGWAILAYAGWSSQTSNHE